MKVAVQFSPFFGQIVVGPEPVLQAIHSMEGANNVGFPLVVAVRYCTLEALPFDKDPDIGQVIEVGDGDGGDEKPAMVLSDHQTLSHEARQRLAQSREACRVYVPQRFEAKLRAGLEHTADNVRAHALQYVCRERFSACLEAAAHWCGSPAASAHLAASKHSAFFRKNQMTARGKKGERPQRDPHFGRSAETGPR